MALTVLLIASLALMVLTFFVAAMKIHALLLVIPIVMFCIRRYGILVKMNNILTAEGVIDFIFIVLSAILSKIVIVKLLLFILVRAIFIGIVIYDSKVYTYIEEEKS